MRNLVQKERELRLRALRFGYNLSFDEEQRRRAIRASVKADTNSHHVGLKRTRDMIDNALLHELNRIYRETGPHRGNYPNPDYYELIKPWEKRANRDFDYLNEWGRDFYKVQKDAEAGRVYLIRPEDIHLPPDYGLTLARIFSEDDKTRLKRDLSENGPLRRKLEQHRKQKVY
jgi:hypothetical protein